MNHFNTLLLFIAISLILFSCKKDDPIECIIDPRTSITGTYNMEDSVFFLSSFLEVRNYDMTIHIDSLEGDSVLLENMFDFSIDLKAVYNETSNSLIIPAQIDDEAFVSGVGNFSGSEFTYSASYDDGGYSFRGTGIKN